MNIILIHGFPLDGSMWRPQTEALTTQGHTVHTPNMPGFGGSPAWEKNNCSIDAFAEEIHKLIAVGGEPAVVGGFSMGGYILCSLLREYPEDVRAAMFFDTRAEADTPEARQNRLNSIDDVLANGPGKLCQTMAEKLLSPRSSKALQEQVLAIMRKQSPEGIIGAQWAMSRRRDQSDLLPQLKIPALVVVGAEDTITPPAVAMNIHNKIAGSMLTQIANAGHLANLEQPAAVNNAITTFLHTVV